MLSEPGLVTYKTLTPQDREMMLAYADKCPRATLQAIAGRWFSHDDIEPFLTVSQIDSGSVKGSQTLVLRSDVMTDALSAPSKGLWGL